MHYRHLPGNVEIFTEPLIGLTELLIERVAARREATRRAARPRVGASLRPDKDTPLWFALVEEIKPLLKKRGNQANLARLLGLDRQSVNAFVTSKTRMPDAERTLQILAWMLAARQKRPLF